MSIIEQVTVRDISTPFPNFQPNTLIMSEQVNDNNDEIQYRTNLLIKAFNKLILDAGGLEAYLDKHIINFDAFVKDTGDNFLDTKSIIDNNKVEINAKVDGIKVDTDKKINDVDVDMKAKTLALQNSKGDKLELKNTLLYLKSGNTNISVADLAGLGGGTGGNVGSANVAFGQPVVPGDWLLDTETNLYAVTINHRLTTSTPLITFFDEITGFNMFDVVKVVDANTVKVYNDKPVNTYISVINGSSKVELVQAIIDDDNITPLRTYSSEKINALLASLSSKAKDITIEDVDGLFTSTHVEGALKENKVEIESLKSNVNNGKTVLATSIGSPIASTDTFSQMGSKVDVLTNTFKTKLTNKGVVPNYNDKLYNLINKIDNIEVEKHNFPKWFDGRDFWGKGEPMSIYASIPASCSVGDNIYFFGGYARNTPTNTNLCYDTTSNTWSEKAPIPIIIANSSCCSIGSKIYLSAGQNANGTIYSFYVYDTIKNTWEKKIDRPLPTSSHKMVSIGTNVYVIGGTWSSGTIEGSISVFDTITEIWSSIPITTVNAYRAQCAEAIGNSIYLFGGGGSGYTNSVRKYDIITKTWSLDGTTTYSFDSASSFYYNGQVFLVGGAMSLPVSTSSSNYLQVYDIATKTSSLKSHMPTGRAHSSASCINGVGYVIGGNNSNTVGVNEFYIL